jgi:hypothetical protein
MSKSCSNYLVRILFSSTITGSVRVSIQALFPAQAYDNVFCFHKFSILLAFRGGVSTKTAIFQSDVFFFSREGFNQSINRMGSLEYLDQQEGNFYDFQSSLEFLGLLTCEPWQGRVLSPQKRGWDGKKSDVFI